VTEPLVLGHEFAGEVEAVAPGVTRVTPGDRVAVEPGHSCGACEHCLAGHPNLCPQVRFCGTPPTDGALREHLTWPAEALYPMPESLSFAEGAGVETLTVALHAVRLAKVRPGDSVAVLGCGPIGLCIIRVAQLAGATEVFATEIVPERLAAAARMIAPGAGQAIDARQDPVPQIMELTGARGVDVVLEAAGVPETPHQAIRAVRIGGAVVIVGIFDEEMIEIGSTPSRRKGLTIKFCRRTKHAVERAIDLVARGLVDLKPLLTHRFPLERTGEAFELVRHKRDGVIKAIIEMGGKE
jgi:L-iditol 2-dehydrogenase